MSARYFINAIRDLGTGTFIADVSISSVNIVTLNFSVEVEAGSYGAVPEIVRKLVYDFACDLAKTSVN